MLNETIPDAHSMCASVTQTTDWGQWVEAASDKTFVTLNLATGEELAQDSRVMS